jgi:alkylhydroperoxidase family enzyme
MRRRNVEQQHAGALGKNQLIRIRVRRWIRRLRSSRDGNAGSLEHQHHDGHLHSCSAGTATSGNEKLFDSTERGVLRFTDLLTSFPGNIDDVDLDALGEHLDEEQVIELVLAIATANWTNRVNDGLRIPLPR